MLTDIEEKIAERLDARITQPKRVDIAEAHGALAMPAIDILVGGGGFAKVAQKYKIKANVFVVVTFRNLRSVKDRRQGVYPLLEAVVALLAGHSLGLAIDPLVPKRLDNITEKEEAEDGRIVFQLEFETGFVIEKLSDEEITDLIALGLNYYLTPGDETADATDLVTFNEA